jgi:hypothetical protein
VTAENVDALGSRDWGGVDLLSVDVDGNDYWIWKALSVVNPRLGILEFNAVCGPEKSVTSPTSRISAWTSTSSRTDASLLAFVKFARTKGYRLVGVQSVGFNAFFVRDGVGDALLPERSVQECYERNGRLRMWAPVLDLMMSDDQKWDEV